jgi:hypothetical protein
MMRRKATPTIVLLTIIIIKYKSTLVSASFDFVVEMHAHSVRVMLAADDGRKLIACAR